MKASVEQLINDLDGDVFNKLLASFRTCYSYECVKGVPYPSAPPSTSVEELEYVCKCPCLSCIPQPHAYKGLDSNSTYTLMHDEIEDLIAQNKMLREENATLKSGTYEIKKIYEAMLKYHEECHDIQCKLSTPSYSIMEDFEQDFHYLIILIGDANRNPIEVYKLIHRIHNRYSHMESDIYNNIIMYNIDCVELGLPYDVYDKLTKMREGLYVEIFKVYALVGFLDYIYTCIEYSNSMHNLTTLNNSDSLRYVIRGDDNIKGYINISQNICELHMLTKYSKDEYNRGSFGDIPCLYAKKYSTKLFSSIDNVYSNRGIYIPKAFKKFDVLPDGFLRSRRDTLNFVGNCILWVFGHCVHEKGELLFTEHRMYTAYDIYYFEITYNTSGPIVSYII